MARFIFLIAFVAVAVPFVKGAEPEPRTPEAALKRADDLAAADKPGDARRYYEAAIQYGNPYVRRRAYMGLLAVYVKTGRQDLAVNLGEQFRTWLKQVDDKGSEPELDVILGECYFALGHRLKADQLFTAALREERRLAPEVVLRALSGAAELATQSRDEDEAKKRWAKLETAARANLTLAKETIDASLRIKASQYLADALHNLGRTADALAVLEPLPELQDKLPDPLGRRDTQRQRAVLTANLGRYDEAAILFTEALDLHKKHGNGRRLPAADILAEWSGIAGAANRKNEATKLRDKAAEEYKAILVSPTEADLEGGGLLLAFFRLQSLTQQARQFRMALDLNQSLGERWVEDPLLAARMKADRGMLEVLAASYPAARSQLEQALTTLEAANPLNLRILPRVLIALSTAEIASEAAEQAEKHVNRCVELYDTYQLPDDVIRANCDFIRGVVASQQGSYKAAVSHYRAGLARCDVVGPAADAVRLNVLLSIALIHREQADFDAAEDHLRRASALLVRFTEPDDLIVGLIDSVRADLFIVQGNIKLALALVPRIEAVCAKNNVRAGYQWETARHIRCLDLMDRKEYALAEEGWTELAAVQRRTKRISLARSLNYLGSLAENKGQDDVAKAHYEEARVLQANRPAAPALIRGMTHWRLALLADRHGRREEAKKLLNEVFDVADQARINTFGEASQRAQLFAQFNTAFEQLAWWHFLSDEGEDLLRVITRSRSRTLLDQILATGMDPRERIAKLPNSAALLAREAAARKKVTRLRAAAQLLPVDQPDDPAVKKALDDINQAQAEFADAWREIINADPETQVLIDTTRADKTVAKLQKTGFGPGTAVLAYMVGDKEAFAVFAPGPGVKPMIYRLSTTKTLAEVVGEAPKYEPTDGFTVGLRGIVLRRVGPQPEPPPPQPAEPRVPLSREVAGRVLDHYIQQITDPGFNPTRGIVLTRKQAPKETIPARPETIGDAVLPPKLLTAIKNSGAKRLVVVPDGALHKLPLECLVVSSTAPTPQYGLDVLPAISYTPSLALLDVVATRPQIQNSPPTLLTVGDPAYPEGATTSNQPMQVARSQSRGGAGFKGTLPRLPFTAVESRRVREAFPPELVTSLQGEAATEKNVTAALPGKKYIHLAAHGFADEGYGNLFAAVALARSPSPNPPPDDDGFLSLYEIYRLNLSGSELTVLSACVTSVGPQKPLEAGVTLAGAFLCAGSRHVVASCWSVDDKATADLMGEFFKTIRTTDGKTTYSEALRAARLKVRATPGCEAPFFWAPFVFFGPPD